jgi:glutathione S-transferase
MIPTVKQELPDEKVVAKYQKGMETTLDQIEQIWLQNGDKKYLTGDKISVADIMACCELEQPSMAG